MGKYELINPYKQLRSDVQLSENQRYIKEMSECWYRKNPSLKPSSLLHPFHTWQPNDALKGLE